MSAQQQLFEEPFSYHRHDDWGFFSLLTRNQAGQTAQNSYRLDMMPTVIGLVDPSIDTWLSQAEFMRPNRRVVNLLRIGLMFVDIDCYKEKWAQGKTPEALAQGLLYFCDVEGVPPPSIIVFSGRGLQAKWLIEGTIPRQALPRWNACQRYLVDKLRTLGADPAAKDASRVLRLVNTVNTKSGELCHVVHVTNSADGKPVRYDFEYLAEWLLPVARSGIEHARQTKLQVITGGKAAPGLRGFSGRTLAWHRLEDLRTLATLRGGVDEGARMMHLFWQLNFLLLSGASNTNLMWHEAAEIARQVDPTWGYRSPELSSLYQKALAHEKGEKVQFQGREMSPLYTPKNDTLINLFGITDDEQRQLKTIISPDMARSRDKDRHTARRRAAGAMARAEYLGTAEQRRTAALELRAQGKSWAEVAKEAGYKNAEAARKSCK